MSVSVAVRIQQAGPVPPTTGLFRVVNDDECPDWGVSRTKIIQRADGSYFSQLPAVYGYSPEPVVKPSDYRVDETFLLPYYYRLNDYDIHGVNDGMGDERCENFLFKADTALYNKKGFPYRELLTMSGNLLEPIEWVTRNGARYLMFRTLRPTQDVRGMTYVTHPQYVHRFNLVMDEEGVCVVRPIINRDGYLYYYLSSREGVGYMPERFVKAA